MRTVSYPGDLIQQWALGGVLYSGATNYDCYPQGAAATTLTAGGLSWSPGAAGTLIAAGGITNGFYLTHVSETTLTTAPSTTITLSTTSNQNVRQVAFQPDVQTTITPDVIPLVPWLVPASDAVTAQAASESPSAQSVAYLGVLKKYPQPVPDLMRIDPTVASAIQPTTPTGTVVTAAAGAWNYTAAPTQLIAATATAILIYSVTISSVSAVDFQVSFMTGGAGSEVEFGVFGVPRRVGTALQLFTFALPFPIFVPTGTRIAARSRSSAGGTAHECGYTYVPIPLY